jgi:hypothetical protein
MRLATLLLALLAPAAFAQTAPPPPDADLQAARDMTCAAFLSEVSRNAGVAALAGQSPSFARVWGDLLTRNHALGKVALGSRMFGNTRLACERNRARTLGATMDAEFARL